ncbi:DUF4365 domain-containing protein [Vibrio fluvialis]
MARYQSTDRVGVNEIERITINELKWIFREQPIVDMGIDAHLERVQDGDPDGKLLALQIKTGTSHFTEKTDSLVYYGKIAHLNYWTGHSLPVILVAHIPATNETYWQVINENTVTRTDKGWKVEIPKINVFGKSTIDELTKILEGTPEQQKYRKLALDEPLMKHIAAGGKVSVGLEVWINKTLGRTPVHVYVCDSNGNEVLERQWFQYYRGYSVRDLVVALFPWSYPIVDEGFYEQHAEDDYDDWYDDWNDRLRVEVNEYGGIDNRGDPDVLYPYTESCSEVEFYRLELTLNELGRAFLVVSNYMSNK